MIDVVGDLIRIILLGPICAVQYSTSRLIGGWMKDFFAQVNS